MELSNAIYVHTVVPKFYKSVSLQWLLKRLASTFVWLSQYLSLLNTVPPMLLPEGEIPGFSFLLPSLPSIQSWGSNGAHSSRSHGRNESWSRSCLFFSWSSAWRLVEISLLQGRVSGHVSTHKCKRLWMATNESTGGLMLLWISTSAALRLHRENRREFLAGADHILWAQELQKFLCGDVVV